MGKVSLDKTYVVSTHEIFRENIFVVYWSGSLSFWFASFNQVKLPPIYSVLNIPFIFSQVHQRVLEESCSGWYDHLLT